MSDYVASYGSNATFAKVSTALFGSDSAINYTMRIRSNWAPHPLELAQYLTNFEPRTFYYRFDINSIPRDFAAMAKLYLYRHYAYAQLRKGQDMAALLTKELDLYPYKQKKILRVIESCIISSNVILNP